MVRQAHHPEQSRRAISKFQAPMTQTGFEYPRAFDMRYFRLKLFSTLSFDPELTAEGPVESKLNAVCRRQPNRFDRKYFELFWSLDIGI